MKIVVLDGHTLNPGDNPWDELAQLAELTVYERTPPEQIAPRAGDADIVLTNKTPLTAATLAQLPRLRFIAVLATGYNVVDVAAARARAIPVSNVPEYGTDSVAQHVFALLLELCHHVGQHDAAVKAGEWIRSIDFCFWKTAPLELSGLTMGIVGLGRIGGRVGALAHAFGMSVLAAGGTRREEPGYAPFAWTTVPQLFATADVISLHCPLTADNVRFVNRDCLQHVKPSAFFINVARGGLVDEAALAEALNAGQLAGAAVDVVSNEPMHADNPLLTARNCIITPHIAWASLAARRRLMVATVKNLEAFIAGRPINVVN
ncbi:MAG TPA: D-2-hydroxyacid dehydrogenase [Candidatus Margulisiibacteriota bacterium]|nr:D-2-hydroxyacid dehydrogenase [Candidatus Margulisiibacteriota bacterium]